MHLRDIAAIDSIVNELFSLSDDVYEYSPIDLVVQLRELAQRLDDIPRYVDDSDMTPERQLELTELKQYGRLEFKCIAAPTAIEPHIQLGDA
jgi:hypothetical protein